MKADIISYVRKYNFQHASLGILTVSERGGRGSQVLLAVSEGLTGVKALPAIVTRLVLQLLDGSLLFGDLLPQQGHFLLAKKRQNYVYFQTSDCKRREIVSSIILRHFINNSNIKHLYFITANLLVDNIPHESLQWFYDRQ